MTEVRADVGRFATLVIGGTARTKGDNTEVITLREKSADPSEPSVGTAIIWLSDGTGKGDDGDVMIASNPDSTTRYSTLFDFSGGSTW